MGHLVVSRGSRQLPWLGLTRHRDLLGRRDQGLERRRVAAGVVVVGGTSLRASRRALPSVSAGLGASASPSAAAASSPPAFRGFPRCRRASRILFTSSRQKAACFRPLARATALCIVDWPCPGNPPWRRPAKVREVPFEALPGELQACLGRFSVSHKARRVPHALNGQVLKFVDCRW